MATDAESVELALEHVEQPGELRGNDDLAGGNVSRVAGDAALRQEVHEPLELVARQVGLEAAVDHLAGRASELLQPSELGEHAVGRQLATLEVGSC